MKSFIQMISTSASQVRLHVRTLSILQDLTHNTADIGGLETIVSSLRESVIYPLLYPNLFTSSSSLLGAPKGVLLFGPPGCGKTMLAKALAKESGATFINIAASVLTNKWYGESNKLVAGLFSLARKVQPSIIFIDEIDSFLRERTKGDHEVTGMMKAEFMTCVFLLRSPRASYQIFEPRAVFGTASHRPPTGYWFWALPTDQMILILLSSGVCPSVSRLDYQTMNSG